MADSHPRKCAATHTDLTPHLIIKLLVMSICQIATTGISEYGSITDYRGAYSYLITSKLQYPA